MISKKKLEVSLFHNLVMELVLTPNPNGVRIEIEVSETCFNAQVFRGNFNSCLDFENFEDSDLLLEVLNYFSSKGFKLNEVLEFVGLSHLEFIGLNYL